MIITPEPKTPELKDAIINTQPTIEKKTSEPPLMIITPKPNPKISMPKQKLNPKPLAGTTTAEPPLMIIYPANMNEQMIKITKAVPQAEMSTIIKQHSGKTTQEAQKEMISLEEIDDLIQQVNDDLGEVSTTPEAQKEM